MESEAASAVIWERAHVVARPMLMADGKRAMGRRGGVWGPGVRWGHTCNIVKGGRFLYVFGGYGDDGRQTNEVHVFDTVKQTWSKPMVKGIPPSPRDSHSCTTVGNKLYVFGGTDGGNPLNDLYVLDTSTNTWIIPNVCGNRPVAREGHSAVLLGKKIFIFGGCGKSKKTSMDVYYDDLHILDTENNMWEELVTSGTPPSARDNHTCSSWGSNLIVVGGQDISDTALSDVHMFDTDAMVWKELDTSGEKLPPRAGHTTMALGRKLFVFGGYTDHQSLFNDLHILNVDTGIWSKVSNMNQGPSARFAAAADCLDPQNGTFIFIGGCGPGLRAMDDMYYLHTDIQAGDGEVSGRREKLSFRKELKERCQESRYANDYNVHKIGMLSDSAQTDRLLCDSNHAEEKTFQATVVDTTDDGYIIETVINGHQLRGVLLPFNPSFNSGRPCNINKRKRGMDTDARSGGENQLGLTIAKATRQTIQEAHEGGLEQAPSSIQEIHLRGEHHDCLNDAVREAACENPAATKEMPSKLPNKDPTLEGHGNLINGHVQ